MQIIEEMRKKRGVEFDNQLSANDLKELVERYKALIRERKHLEFRQDPMDQLWGAITAVFGSWNNPRAIAYRELNDIPSDMGTAVNIQAMVFGNMGEDCGTGVALHPQSGHRRECLLRGIPDQCPGRGCRRRHPDPAAHQQGSKG